MKVGEGSREENERVIEMEEEREVERARGKDTDRQTQK